jgi:hypothetical protein
MALGMIAARACFSGWLQDTWSTGISSNGYLSHPGFIVRPGANDSPLRKKWPPPPHPKLQPAGFPCRKGDAQTSNGIIQQHHLAVAPETYFVRWTVDLPCHPLARRTPPALPSTVPPTVTVKCQRGSISSPPPNNRPPTPLAGIPADHVQRPLRFPSPSPPYLRPCPGKVPTPPAPMLGSSIPPQRLPTLERSPPKTRSCTVRETLTHRAALNQSRATTRLDLST